MLDALQDDKTAMVLGILIVLFLFASFLKAVAGFVAGATKALALVGLVIIAIKVTMELFKEGADKLMPVGEFKQDEL